MSKLASSLSFPALAINWPLALCDRCLVRCGRALLMVHRSPFREEWAKTKHGLHWLARVTSCCQLLYCLWKKKKKKRRKGGSYELWERAGDIPPFCVSKHRQGLCNVIMPGWCLYTFVGCWAAAEARNHVGNPMLILRWLSGWLNP